MIDNNILLVNIDRIKSESYLDLNVNEKSISVAAKYIQDGYVEKALGRCLSNKLKELVCDGQICNPMYSCYKILLDDYIFPIFTYGIQAELAQPLTYKERNAGVIKSSDDSIITSVLDEVKELRKTYYSHLNMYITRLKEFIICNYKELPELCCTCGCCNFGPKQTYQLPVSLSYVSTPYNDKIRNTRYNRKRWI